jgi:hypothetical protein
MEPSPIVKFAILLFCVPFFVAGIMLAGTVSMWITGATPHNGNGWFLLVFPPMAFVGIFMGALVAYGIIVFFVGWRSPNSPWLALTGEEEVGRFRQFVYPVFRVVRALALWLAPKRH